MPAVSDPQLPTLRQALWRDFKESFTSLFRRRPRCGRCSKKMTDRFVLGVFGFSPPPDNADFMWRCEHCGGAFCFECLGFKIKTQCPGCGSKIVVFGTSRRGGDA